MLSSPGCWAAFGELLASEYGDPARMRVHGLTVDAYAVQHPGVETAAARRSAGIHLARLLLVVERGLALEDMNAAIRVIDRRKDDFEWLTPPTMAGTLTVANVLGAVTVAEHEERVWAWARSAWGAWEGHHARIREWMSESPKRERKIFR
jgi:hypothetical protein